MIIDYHKPKNPILLKYIEGYYFLTNSQGEMDNKYLTFPNNYCIVTITNECAVYLGKDKAIVSEDKFQNCFSSIIANYKRPIQIEYQGNVKELTIYFKAAGINTFLPKKLIHYLNDSFQIFDPHDDFLPTMLHVLEATTTEKAIEILENYWISKITDFDHGILHTAIQLLENSEVEYSIQQVADKCLTSRQNLFKEFNLHLGKTPSDFKKIHRFRNTLNSFNDKKNLKNLSSVLVNTTFYDQSHFIKDFKSLTGFLPKDLLKNLDCNKGEDIKWLWI